VTARALQAAERMVTATPVWLRLLDRYTGRGPVGPIEVGLSREDGGRWVPFDARYEAKPDGNLGFPGLGRVTVGRAGLTFTVRIALTVPQTVVETAGSAAPVELTITTWDRDNPPPAPVPITVSCWPGPDYGYGPGVPVHPGRVLDGTGNGVAGARVTASAVVAGAPHVEEVRTGADGWFRIPLRWSSGATTVLADKAGAAGSATFSVPADLGSVSVITLT
jgi:hypothetical protein